MKLLLSVRWGFIIFLCTGLAIGSAFATPPPENSAKSQNTIVVEDYYVTCPGSNSSAERMIPLVSTLVEQETDNGDFEWIEKEDAMPIRTQSSPYYRWIKREVCALINWGYTQLGTDTALYYAQPTLTYGITTGLNLLVRSTAGGSGILLTIPISIATHIAPTLARIVISGVAQRTLRALPLL